MEGAYGAILGVLVAEVVLVGSSGVADQALGDYCSSSGVVVVGAGSFVVGEWE